MSFVILELLENPPPPTNPTSHATPPLTRLAPYDASRVGMAEFGHDEELNGKLVDPSNKKEMKRRLNELLKPCQPSADKCGASPSPDSEQEMCKSVDQLLGIE